MTTPNPSSPLARTLRRYLEECASFCPYCESPDQIERSTADVSVECPREAMPLICLPCQCGLCSGTWTERYRLESVAAGGEEASS